MASDYDPKHVGDAIDYQFGRLGGYFYFILENKQETETKIDVKYDTKFLIA